MAEADGDMTIAQLQENLRTWRGRPAGQEDRHAVLGAGEEFGELCQVLLKVLSLAVAQGGLNGAYLKGRWGAKGTADDPEAAALDAVCDAIVYLVDFANWRGWDMQAALTAVWREVEGRDYRQMRRETAALARETAALARVREALAAQLRQDPYVPPFLYANGRAYVDYLWLTRLLDGQQQAIYNGGGGGV